MNFFAKTWQRLTWALTPASRKQKMLDHTLAFLGAYHETRELLKLAKAEGINIGWAPKLIGSDTLGQVVRNKKTRQAHIEVAPTKNASGLASTLIHELRHVWQDKTMGSFFDTNCDAGSAERSVLYTRVREADAFAFTNAMVQHINYHGNIILDIQKAAEDFLTKSGKDDITDDELAKISAEVKAKPRPKPPDAKAEMARVFTAMLKGLDDYDDKAMRRYYVLYAHPLLDPQPHTPGETVDVAKLRTILKTGLKPTAPDYMADLDDAALVDTVMSGVAPKIRESLKLMDAFEAAAAKGGLSANDNLDMREHIRDTVEAAQKETKMKLKMPKAKVGL
jgi:hypothetical protein